MVPAIGRALDPVPLAGEALDVVHVARLDLAHATRLALGRRLFRWSPRPRRQAALCRALLRGEDYVLSWERRLWLPRNALASRSVRRIVKPVVFDRTAIEVGALHHVVPRSVGALARWSR